MLKKGLHLATFCLIFQIGWSQSEFNSTNPSIVQSIKFQSVGPTIMSGRVVDVDVNPENPTEFYVGYASGGLYISFNRGLKWQPFMNGLPPVAVHDLALQTEAQDLIVGTHGRSIYKVNLKAIQQLNETVLVQDLKVFDLQKINYSENWGSNWSKWLASYEPETVIDYYVKKAGVVQIQVLNDAGVVVFEDIQNAVSGINQWNYKVEASKSGVERWTKKDKKVILKPAKNNKTYLIQGKYQIKLTQGTVSQQTTLEITKDERK